MTSVKTYRVEGLAASVAIKAPVKVATTTNITLSGEQTIDGVAVTMWPGYGVSSQVEDDRVLVKNQTTATQNGIYQVRTTAWARAKDFDSGSDFTKGTLIPVKSGTVGANTYWRVTTSTDPITIGTDNITFEPAGQFWSNTVVAIGSVGGGTQDIDLNLGNVFTMTVDTSATTFTFSNWPSSGTYREALLIITNGGSQAITWPAATKFHNGDQPILSTSGTDWLLICSTDGGTTPHLFVIAIGAAT